MAQVKSAIALLLNKDKPIRITVGKIGSSLGLKALLEKHLDKMPQTNAYLELVTETVEDFQIRRVEWAVGELDRREDILEWKILRLAGLRTDYGDKVRNAIAKQLN